MPPIPAINGSERTPPRLPLEAFRTVVELTPLVSIDFVVRDQAGRLLVGHRKNRPAQGSWFVPGGRLGKNETRLEAFARLARLELGVELAIDRSRFLGVFEHIYSDNFAGDPRFGTHYVVLAYALEADPAEFQLPGGDQHNDYLWMPEEELLRRDDVHAYTKAYCASLHH